MEQQLRELIRSILNEDSYTDAVNKINRLRKLKKRKSITPEKACEIDAAIKHLESIFLLNLF